MTIVRRQRGLGIITVAFTLYAAVMVARAWRQRPIDRSPKPPATAPADTNSDAIVNQALAQIPVDSTEIKTGWRDDVRGVDLDSLPPPKRELMLRLANSERCTCGCGFTLAACRKFDLTCPVSGPRVVALRDSVVRRLVPSTRGLRTRPELLHS